MVTGVLVQDGTYSKGVVSIASVVFKVAVEPIKIEEKEKRIERRKCGKMATYCATKIRECFNVDSGQTSRIF